MGTGFPGSRADLVIGGQAMHECMTPGASNALIASMLPVTYLVDTFVGYGAIDLFAKLHEIISNRPVNPACFSNNQQPGQGSVCS